MALGLSLPVQAKNYKSLLKKWSKHTETFSYQTMRVGILLDATYFSEEFRRAHSKQHIRKKLLDDNEEALFLEKQERRQREGHEFFVSMYAPKDQKRFNLDKSTFWKARLTTESGEVLRPVTVEFVEVSPYTEVMFPYVDRWSHAYRVVFPKQALGKAFSLKMHSPVGEARLNWKNK